MTNNKFKKPGKTAASKHSSMPSDSIHNRVDFNGIANALTLFVESDAFKSAEKEAAAIRAARC